VAEFVGGCRCPSPSRCIASHQGPDPPEPEPEPSLSLLLLREFVPTDEPDITKHEKPTTMCTSTNPMSTTVMPPSLTAIGTDTSDHHATATATVFNGLGRTSSSPSNVADGCCHGLGLHQARRSVGRSVEEGGR
uniref:Uncharacterized protein n=1 Tax=Oryza glaberrima TaxID=4538 RepID=I1NRI0_ORYGL